MVATDAPLLPHQLKRLARRAALGLARTGSVAGNGSGDIFLAFSTANPGAAAEARARAARSCCPNERMNPLFEATVQATEEAIVNALVGRRDDDRPRRPQGHRRCRTTASEVLKKYGRLTEGK